MEAATSPSPATPSTRPLAARLTGITKTYFKPDGSVLVDALTTILGFGALMVASHRGLESLGRVLTLGVTTCTITSLVFLPAVLRILGPVSSEEESDAEVDDEADEPVCTVKSTKQKDSMDGLTWSFRLDLMNVSKIDPDATSLVVNPLTEAHQPKKRKRASGNQKVLLDALKRAIQEVGNFVGIDGIPSGQKVVHVDSWRNYFDVSTHLQGDSARRVFDREVGKLGQDGQIRMSAKYCWIPMD